MGLKKSQAGQTGRQRVRVGLPCAVGQLSLARLGPGLAAAAVSLLALDLGQSGLAQHIELVGALLIWNHKYHFLQGLHKLRGPFLPGS